MAPSRPSNALKRSCRSRTSAVKVRTRAPRSARSRSSVKLARTGIFTQTHCALSRALAAENLMFSSVGARHPAGPIPRAQPGAIRGHIDKRASGENQTHARGRKASPTQPCGAGPLSLAGTRSAGEGAERTGGGDPPPNYRTGEKAAGISSLFSWRTGRTPACGGQAPPGRRDSSRTRARSFKSL